MTAKEKTATTKKTPRKKSTTAAKVAKKVESKDQDITIKVKGKVGTMDIEASAVVTITEETKPADLLDTWQNLLESVDFLQTISARTEES